MTYREVVDRLKREGWVLKRQSGSHQIWIREGDVGRIVIAPHSLSFQVPKGTLGAIKRQAGWK